MTALPSTEGRLRLRRFTPEDRHALVAMHAEPRLRELLIDDMPFDDPRFSALFVERMNAFYEAHPGLGIWAAEQWLPALTRDDPEFADAVEALAPEALARLLAPRPEFVGWFNLMPMPSQPEEVELGCRLVPAVWGSGIAIEGGTLLLDHAFTTLGRERVQAVCHPQHRSVHMRLHMLGFHPTGERPYEGVWCSHFAVDAATWRQTRVQALGLRRRAAMAWLGGWSAVEAGARVAQGTEG
jgi:RimJ/RimL family protein N-acetyltransferase